MAVRRVDNVGVVVDDLDAAVAFFLELGLELEGRSPVEGEWAGHVVGLSGMRSEVAMVRVPGGAGRLELTTYQSPQVIPAPPPPVNALGVHRVMFAVDDLRGTLERLRPLGAELIGEVARYEDAYLLCYLRGPGGIVLALSEELGDR